MSKFAVVVCSDSNTVPAACCALLSIDRVSSRNRAAYYLVGIDLSSQDHEDIAAFAANHGVDISVLAYSTPADMRKTSGRWSSATLARLFMDKLLPGDLQRVLYIDVDVLALSSIDPLWTLDLGENLVAAADDYIMAFPEKAKARQTRLGLQHGPSYFNAGVILFSWQECLREQVFAHSREILERGAIRLDANDQDILNIVCQGRWKPLDHGWNVQTGLMPFVNPAFIVHFTGRRKPWQSSRNWRHRAFSTFYDQALRNTRWGNFVRQRGIIANARDLILSIGSGLGDTHRRGKVKSYFSSRQNTARADRSIS